MHPGETRLELTAGRHHTWKGLCRAVQRTCKACDICKPTKKKSHKCGHLPPKPAPEIVPLHTLCVDLVGPFDCSKKDKAPREAHLSPTALSDNDQPSNRILRLSRNHFASTQTGWPTISSFTGYLDIRGLQKQPWTREKNLPLKSVHFSGANVVFTARQLPAEIHNRIPGQNDVPRPFTT